MLEASELNYECEICAKKFPSIRNRINHIKTIHSGDILKCSLCPYQTNYQHYLKRHVQDNHKESSIFCCELCSYVAKSNFFLNKHFKLRHTKDAKMYKCSECEYSSPYPGNQKRHFSQSHNKGEFKCSVCNFTSQTNLNIKRHVQRTHNDKARNIKCDICGKVLANKDTFYVHKKTHLDTKNVKCGICSIETTESKMKSHVRQAHSEIQDIMKCSKCNYASNNSSFLKQHFKRIHGVRKKFKCDLCPFESIYKDSLREHIDKKHSEKLIMHKCDQCDYEVKTLKTFKMHQKVHEEGTYSCKIRDCGFKSKIGMSTHFKTVHTPRQTPLTCRVKDCNFETLISHNLKQHDRIEHRLIQCDLCPYKGKYEFHLKKHKNQCHSDNPVVFTCDICDYTSKHDSHFKKHVDKQHKMELED